MIRFAWLFSRQQVVSRDCACPAGNYLGVGKRVICRWRRLLQIEGYIAHRTVVAVDRYPINRPAYRIENNPAAQIIVDAADVIVAGHQTKTIDRATRIDPQQRINAAAQRIDDNRLTVWCRPAKPKRVTARIARVGWFPGFQSRKGVKTVEG